MTRQQHLCDTTSFLKSNGERCAIYAEASIDYPEAYGDKASTERLQRLFAAFVLNAPDSLDMADAMRATVGNSLHQYDFVSQWPGDGLDMEDSDDMVVYKYNTKTIVTAVYNKNSVVSFCKIETIKKNDKLTSVTHRYYNFDLESMSYVDLRRLFRDDAIGDVTRLLRAKLLEQNKAANNDQLNDMGFFNVDNLTASRNFFFDDNGVTWSFLPGQLAVDAIGEPQILLAYDQLSELACDGSLLNRVN